jgi:hypothetical protein
MIPMSCPSCGRKGNVPLDRLNTRMHCKKCDAVFHLDATGKPALGEPPSSKGSKAARAAARAKEEPLDPIGIVASKLVKVPKPIWIGLASLLGCYFVYLISGLFVRAPASPGENFAERNMTAAMAFLNQDVATLKAMTTADTQDGIVTVVENFRSQVGDKTGKGAEDMVPVPQIPEELGEEPAVEISIQPPKLPGADEAPPIFYFDLIWIKGKTTYFINGKATLASNLEREKYRKEMARRAAAP